MNLRKIIKKVDEDPRACYFKQANYGRFIRMALILKLLKESDTEARGTNDSVNEIRNDMKCENPRCITTTEQELINLKTKQIDANPDIYIKLQSAIVNCEQKKFVLEDNILQNQVYLLKWLTILSYQHNLPILICPPS